MKTRDGFVSNSSSSSFIVIGNGPRLIPAYASFRHMLDDNGNLRIGEQGEAQFGWTPEDHTDFWSRANFCYLQACYARRMEWVNMLNETLVGTLDVRGIVWTLQNPETDDYDTPDLRYAYIDHQSNAGDGENIDMFDSPERLEDFLFCEGSKIHTDNDNH
jgi:hypothetical protein